jgi:cytochrome c biogenesis protein CcmG, thiol:disulfide interchange protein DsbE
MLIHMNTRCLSFLCVLTLCLAWLTPSAQAGWWPFAEPEPPAPTRKALLDLLNQPAPDYAFRALIGADAPQNPQAWRGQWVLVNFFASWCAPCRAEFPVLRRLQDQATLKLVGVGHYDRAANTQTMLELLGNPFQLVLEDSQGRGGKLWGVNGVPDSFLLNPSGVIVWRHRGPLTEAILQDSLLPWLKR